MNTEEFLSHLISNDELVPKRCTESYLKNHNLLCVLDELTPKDFGSISDRIKLLKYGGGYCEVCGIRTKISVTGKGFGKYCKNHFHEPKKNIPAHNRKDFDLNLAIKYYKEDKLPLIEVANLLNISNVTLANRFRQNNIEIRSHSENQKLSYIRNASAITPPKIINKNTISVSENTLNIVPYLSETNLYTVLSFAFDDATITRQNRITINDKVFIIDYTVKFPDNKLMFVEFNGYHHYTTTKAIMRDYTLRDYCFTNDIILVEIPYFVQLFTHNFSKYFHRELVGKNITTNQPSGFIVSKIVLPYDYCPLGIDRFLNDISISDQTSEEILNSLIGRNEVEVYSLKTLYDSLKKSYFGWNTLSALF